MTTPTAPTHFDTALEHRDLARLARREAAHVGHRDTEGARAAAGSLYDKAKRHDAIAHRAELQMQLPEITRAGAVFAAITGPDDVFFVPVTKVAASALLRDDVAGQLCVVVKGDEVFIDGRIDGTGVVDDAVRRL